MIREPVVSGRFYPGSARALEASLEASWSSPLGVGASTVPHHGKLRAVIVPHAGFVYSGPVASWAFQRLAQEDPLPPRLLLLGPKHYLHYGAPAALSAAIAWRTPFGEVPIEADLRELLRGTGPFVLDDLAHLREHSLEVQLPFLQRVYRGHALSVVPLALQRADLATCRVWADALWKVLGQPGQRDVVLVVSSDFSHETPRQEAYKLDGEALDLIGKGDAAGFHELVESENRSICGFIPITVALLALQHVPVRVTKLTYATSMDVIPDDQGVGYAAVALEEVEPAS